AAPVLEIGDVGHGQARVRRHRRDRPSGRRTPLPQALAELLYLHRTHLAIKCRVEIVSTGMRLLWTAASIASLGVWLLVMAVPLEVYRRSGSPVATGLALAVEAIPAVVVGPWAGVLLDRLPRKRILQGAYLGGAAGVALMLAGPIAAIYA